jgi:hypothetical protein
VLRDHHAPSAAALTPSPSGDRRQVDHRVAEERGGLSDYQVEHVGIRRQIAIDERPALSRDVRLRAFAKAAPLSTRAT